MLKKYFGEKISRQLNYKRHVVLRSFGGAKTQCMEDYIKPTVNLSSIIPHCRTNNLPGNENSLPSEPVLNNTHETDETFS